MAKMDHAKLIYGGDDVDEKGQKTKGAPVTLDKVSWHKVEKILQDELGYIPPLTDARKAVADGLKRKDMAGAYAKIGPVGKDLVFRAKKKTGALSADIELDALIVASYEDERKKKVERAKLGKVLGDVRAAVVAASLDEDLEEKLDALAKAAHEEENVEFIRATSAKINPLQLAGANQLIYDTFVKKDAKKEVNLPSAVANALHKVADAAAKAKDAKAKEAEWKKMDFDAASKEIAKMFMNNMCFKNYVTFAMAQAKMPEGSLPYSEEVNKRKLT